MQNRQKGSMDGAMKFVKIDPDGQAFIKAFIFDQVQQGTARQDAQ